MVINAAYKVLKDPRKRAEYDRKRKISGYSEWGASAGRRTDGVKNPRNTRDRNSAFSSSWKDGYSDRDTRTNVENESGESLADILSDLWKELNTNGAVNLIDDLLSYLDVEVTFTSPLTTIILIS